MIENQVRAKLEAGDTVVGCFLRSPDASLAEFAALQGWDFLIFDCEHGPLSPADLENLARAAEIRSVTPIARLPTSRTWSAMTYLDVGPHGAHFAGIRTVGEVEEAVSGVRYPPIGKRGLAGVRAADFGQLDGFAEYTARANRELLVVVQIETEAAALLIDDIVRVDGVDVLFIGPTDLASSMGLAGQEQHEAVQEQIDRIASAVLRADKVLGTYVRTSDDAAVWIERGARYLATGLEGILSVGMRQFNYDVRQHIAGRVS